MNNNLIEEVVHAYRGKWSVDIVVRKRVDNENPDEQLERQRAHYVALRMKDVFMAEAGEVTC